jgi:iduronate 2-sulfatase
VGVPVCSYPETEQIDLPLHEAGPKDMPPIAFTYEIDGVVNLTSFDIEIPIPYPNASVGAGYPAAPPNVTRSLRKGYYAAVSFTDWNIGLTLDELERLGHKEDTIVALIGGALFESLV